MVGVGFLMSKPELAELNAMHATLCQAFADSTRIALLYELNDKEKHVNQLVDALELPQATISRHLKILRERSRVRTRRQGAYIYYSLADPRVIEALNTLRVILADLLARQHSLTQQRHFTSEIKSNS